LRRVKRDEYGFDPKTESTYLKRDEFTYAEEYNGTCREDDIPPAPRETAPEYDGTVKGVFEKEGKRHKFLKKGMFALTASVIALVSVVFAAYSLDPLGADFLMTGSLSPSSSTGSTDSFPSLPNLNPDFEGNYAWSGMGSEEYVLLGSDYLHAGTFYTNGGTPIATVSGASYDKATNTLTLNNYKGTVINVNLMGNGFKINLIGENSVDYLVAWGAMYGGSVTFTGSGSIKINESQKNPNGILLQCEDSKSCIMIDREATVEVFGQSGAVIIHRTMLKNAIYTLKPIVMSGGVYSTGEFVEYEVNVTDENGKPKVDENGNYITEIKTVKDIGKAQGMTLYDYSVVDENGKPSNHVLFKPE